MRTVVQTLVLVSLVALVGCGGPGGDNNPRNYSPVRGTLKGMDGSPLSYANIGLVPVAGKGGVFAFAQTDGTGNFELKTMQDKVGAVPGEYKLTVKVPPAADQKVPADARPRLEAAIPAKYREDDTTDHTVTIPSGGGTVDLQLK